MKYYTSFPDWQHSVEELITEGDKVAVKISQHATPKATFEGIEPTGAAEVTKLGILTITDGRIREWWGMEDELGRCMCLLLVGCMHLKIDYYP